MNKPFKGLLSLSCSALTLLTLSSTNLCFAASDTELTALASQIKEMQQSHEKRLQELKNKLKQLEAKQQKLAKTQQNSIQKVVNPQTRYNSTNQSFNTSSGRKVLSNSYNPSIGIILNGKYSSFSNNSSDLIGFGIGEEGERGSQGLGLTESELNFSTNVDDKFFGSLTMAIANEDGNDIVELEEAFFQTLAGAGLFNGLSIKAGRAFWTMGYLNEHHSHADDFADRPLPYRAFLNNVFNDDGIQFTYVLPTDLYSEVGGGLYRGNSFPAANSDKNKANSYSVFARVGGDFTINQNWQVGINLLSTTAKERSTNEDLLSFTGNSDLYFVDFRYNWSPTGNPHQKELTLQAEYFLRKEDGNYTDLNTNNGKIDVSNQSNGWYAQATYKFHQQWRAGFRYSKLEAAPVPQDLRGSILDARGYSPQTFSLMGDWTNSEFSRFRLQYNQEELSNGVKDNQIILQYIMSLGAHTAHKY